MQAGQPLAYISKALQGRNLVKSTYEKEMMAILHAVAHWRPYLLGRHFIIKTDHASLKYLLEQRISTPEQQKWISKLMGYDYEIQYKQGKENIVADALSRQFEDQPQLMAISSPIPTWMEGIRQEWKNDPTIQQIIQNTAGHPHFSWEESCLRYKNRIYLLATSSFKSAILTEMHASPAAGHSGFQKTYHRIRQLFYWKGMKKDIQTFVAECDTCQRQKGETVASPGLLQPLPIPETPWRDISMDFIEGLPKSSGKTVILVVVDRLTKYAHFCTLSHPFTAQTVAQVFTDQIFKLHGTPLSIVSDRDRVFTGKFWKEFFHIQGTQLKMSSAYHPQTDGQTEVVNKCLEKYLRCFVNEKPHQWAHWLPMAEWCYNSSYHTSTKMSPYEAVYGHPPPSSLVYYPGIAQVQAVDDTLNRRTQILKQLKDNLREAQNRMKQQADQHRTERTFDIGDWVFLRLQPYRQLSLKIRSSQKLSPRFYGPFKILQRIGTTAYKLDLPSTSKIHPVFHVSCLKPVLGAHDKKVTDLPEIDEEDAVIIQPEAILQTRTRNLRNRTIEEGLIKWKGLDSEDATWEPLKMIQQNFPNFKL